MIDSEDERYAIDEGHMEAHEQELQVLIFGVSATWELILIISTEWWFQELYFTIRSE